MYYHYTNLIYDHNHADIKKALLVLSNAKY